MVNKDASTKELLLLMKMQQEEAREACKILYVRFMPILCGFGQSKGLSFADAEDIAQDVLFQVIESINSFKEECGDGKSWIYRIYQNKIIDRKRREKHFQFEVLMETHPCFEQDLPEQRLETNQLRLALIRAGRRLPEWARQELQPHHGQGRPSKRRAQARDLFRALLDEERNND